MSGDKTVSQLIKMMRDPIDRIINIRHAVSNYGTSSCCYAWPKTERNPEGEILIGNIYDMLGIE
jgi:hypothetical protein